MNSEQRCPIHPNVNMWIMSTTNEWRLYCPECGKRYNDQREPKPLEPVE